MGRGTTIFGMKSEYGTLILLVSFYPNLGVSITCDIAENWKWLTRDSLKVFSCRCATSKSMT